MLTRSVRFGRAAALVAAAVVLVPALALAWKQEASIETRVHQHEFWKVKLESNQCELEARFLFQAPEAAYKDPARNLYRFHARVLLASGKSVETRVFYNDAPGHRVYSYKLDTSAEGCWAKEEHKLQDVDIEGCRGKGCKPEPFK